MKSGNVSVDHVISVGDEIMIRLEARFLSKNYNERRSDEALQI